MFLCLPSTLDRKEELNKWSEHVNLHPIDISYEQLRALNGNQNFQPEDLENSSKRNKISKIFYSFMKEAAAASNHNLVRNSNAFLRNGRKIDPEFEFSWVNDSYSEMQQKFQFQNLKLIRLDQSNYCYQEEYGVCYTILNYLNSNDLITLLYTPRCLRFSVLIKFKSYWKLSSAFVVLINWMKN